MLSKNQKCPFCGASDLTITNGGKCPGCGRRISEKYCSICRRDRRFSDDNQVEGCWSCGAIFSATRNESDEMALLLEEGREKDDEFMLCGNCGKWMDKKELFCQNCGALRSS